MEAHYSYIDYFHFPQELSEEDVRNENIFDKENNASYDDADSSMLRPHSEDKTKSPREARSSMLADIEQTLAALHMTDQSEVAQTVDSAQSEPKIGTTEPLLEVSDDSYGEKTVSDMNPEPYAGDFVVSENVISSTSQTLNSSEVKTDSASINLASSPKLNHTVKAKTGPKVSPKPSPKAGARVSSYISKSPDAPVDKHRDLHERNSVSVSMCADNESIVDPAVINIQCATSQRELETTDIGVPEETRSSSLQTFLKSTDETATNTEAVKPSDSTGADILSIPSDTITVSREDIVSESVMTASKSDKSETVQASDISSENLISDKIGDEDTITEVSRSNTTKNATEAGEADFASKEQSESVTLVSESKEKINPPVVATEINETVPSSPAHEVKPILTNEDVEKNTQQTVTKTELAEQGGSDGGPKEDDKQQKETNEDQTGKGKISKIPVRSGEMVFCFCFFLI